VLDALIACARALSGLRRFGAGEHRLHAFAERALTKRHGFGAIAVEAEVRIQSRQVYFSLSSGGSILCQCGIVAE